MRSSKLQDTTDKNPGAKLYIDKDYSIQDVHKMRKRITLTLELKTFIQPMFILK